MRELGLPFNDSMVLAILRGEKWQTRRPIEIRPPKAQSGDLIWVRESWAEVGAIDPPYLVYGATYPECLPSGVENIPESIHEAGYQWKPSMHMPKRAARIWLPLTAVWEEYLQGISEEDAFAEGFRAFRELNGFAWTYKQFRDGWNRIYGNRPRLSWEDNPVVRVYKWEPEQMVVKW